MLGIVDLRQCWREVVGRTWRQQATWCHDEQCWFRASSPSWWGSSWGWRWRSRPPPQPRTGSIAMGIRRRPVPVRSASSSRQRWLARRPCPAQPHPGRLHPATLSRRVQQRRPERPPPHTRCSRGSLRRTRGVDMATGVIAAAPMAHAAGCPAVPWHYQ